MLKPTCSRLATAYLCAAGIVLAGSTLLAQDIPAPVPTSDLNLAPHRLTGLVRGQWSADYLPDPSGRGSGVVVGHPRVAVTAAHVLYDSTASMRASRGLIPTYPWVSSARWFGTNSSGTEPDYDAGVELELVRNESYAHLATYWGAAELEQIQRDSGAGRTGASEALLLRFNDAILRSSEADIVGLVAVGSDLAGGAFAGLETTPASLQDATVPKLLLGFPAYAFEDEVNPELWSMYQIGPITRPFATHKTRPGQYAPSPAVAPWAGQSGGPWFVRTAANDFAWSVAAIVGRGDGRSAVVSSTHSKKIIKDTIDRAAKITPGPAKLAGDIATVPIAPGQVLSAYMGESVGDVDVFRLKVTLEGDYEIVSTGPLDLVGTLTATGQPAVSDDNSGSGENFHLFVRLKAQSYDIRVRGAYPTVRGSYIISVSSFNSLATGVPNLSVATLSGSKATELTKYSSASAETWLAPVMLPKHVALKSPTSVTFRLRNLGGGSLSLPGGNPVTLTGVNAASYAVLSQPPGLLANTPSAVGDFTVQFNASYNGTHFATLRITSDDPLKSVINIPLQGVGSGFGTQDDHRNTATDAIAAGSSVTNAETDPTGSIDFGGDKDLFVFNVVLPAVYQLRTSGLTDTTGTLYQVKNGKAVKLLTAVDSAGDVNFAMLRLLEYGTYYIEVSGASPLTTGSYTLHVNHQSSAGLLAVDGPTKLTIADGSEAPNTADGTDFGTVKLGSKVTKIFTIRNHGHAAFTIGSMNGINMTGPGGFTLVPPTVSVIAPGKSTTFSLTYQPMYLGVTSLTMSIYALAAGMADNTYTFDILGGKDPIVPLPLHGRISASKGASYFLTSSGQIRVWGYNYRGALGVPDTGSGFLLESPTPTSFGFSSAPTFIAGGSGDRAHVIVWGSEVYGWGKSYVGFGNGVNSNDYNAVASSTVSATRTWAPTNIIQLALASYHSVALSESGSVFTWGRGYQGELGNAAPGTTQALTPINISSRFGGSQVLRIATGTNHNLALDAEGNVWAWGANYGGQLGLGNTTAAKVPTKLPASKFGNQPVVAIACAAYASFAVTDDGVVWAWGDNERGVLGLGDTTDRMAPTRVIDPTTGQPHTFGGQPIVQLSAGGDQVAVLLQGGLSAWTWGALATDAIDMSEPFDHSSTLLATWNTLALRPQLLYNQASNPGLQVSELSVGGERLTYVMDDPVSGAEVRVPLSHNHCLYLATDGSVWSSGSNSYGELGAGNQVSQAQPVNIIAGP